MNTLVKSIFVLLPMNSINRLNSNSSLLAIVLIAIWVSLSKYFGFFGNFRGGYTDFGLVRPRRVAFLPSTNIFLEVDQNEDFKGIKMREGFGSVSESHYFLAEVTNLACDLSTNSLYSLEEINSSPEKIRVPNTILLFQSTDENTRSSVGSYNLQEPKVITFDPNGSGLIIPDAIGTQSVTAEINLEGGQNKVAPPTVLSTVCSDTSLTNASSLGFKFTFPVTVTAVDEGDFA